MNKQQQLELALEKAQKHYSTLETYLDNLNQCEIHLDIAFNLLLKMNTDNNTGIDTISLFGTTCFVQDKIVSTERELRCAQRDIEVTNGNLNDYRQLYDEVLIGNRRNRIVIDSCFSYEDITFSTRNPNKAIVKLANDIVEVYFKPNRDEIDYNLTKRYLKSETLGIWGN
jgi:hypothetical protein